MYHAKLTDKIKTSVPTVYYEEKFRFMVEQYMVKLRNSQNTTSFNLTPREKHVFKGNFIGLMNEREVPEYLHWFIMRVNDIDSSFAFTGEQDTIIIPDTEMIDRIREYYQTVHRI